MHDLSFEFRTVSRPAAAGLIQPHGAAVEVLTLTEEEYLRRLEGGGLFG